MRQSPPFSGRGLMTERYPAGGNASGEGRDIDVRGLVHDIWQRRLLVVLCVVAGAVAGLGYSYSNTRYLSEGVLLTPQISVEDYKRYVFALSNEAGLAQFLEQSGQSETPAAALLRDNVQMPARFAESISPEFSFTDRDARLFGVTTSEPGELVGIRLRLAQREKSKEPPVLLLAEYVRDVAIKVDLDAAILRTCLEYQRREQELRNDDLEADFRLEQVRSKAESLRALMRELPDTATLENRQVVSVAKGNERFLSPMAQLVGAEIEIADLGLAQRARERERIGAQIRRDYYCAARDALSKPIGGRAFLGLLEDILDKALEGRDATLNPVETAANALALQRESWVSKYLSQMRFVAAPEGSQVRIRQPGLAVGLCLGAAFGVALGLLLATLSAWWRENRAVIVAPDR
jgi:hypothetical protein